ncbi:hypothetical protein Y1Q_0002542 [Alligator mississippiensis]|uniref:Uncharacterized protein n=1 Tax=Alligator mississippiensis TaxID=8496 RepID=A0A151NBC2_ALLMI|nr:hypothetical protein Y1Q_0002542 [Alligator mississippiensis]
MREAACGVSRPGRDAAAHLILVTHRTGHVESQRWALALLALPLHADGGAGSFPTHEPLPTPRVGRYS